MPFRNLGLSCYRSHVLLGISGLQCTPSVDRLLINVFTITTDVAREKRTRSDVSLNLLTFHHEVLRMIISMTNPVSRGLALLFLRNLMILMISLMLIMIAHAAIVDIQLSTLWGCGFNWYFLRLLIMILFILRDSFSAVEWKCARTTKFLNGTSRQPTLGLKGSWIRLLLTRRYVITDISLSCVFTGGCRMVDFRLGIRTLYLFTNQALSNIAA